MIEIFQAIGTPKMAKHELDKQLKKWTDENDVEIVNISLSSNIHGWMLAVQFEFSFSESD